MTTTLMHRCKPVLQAACLWPVSALAAASDSGFEAGFLHTSSTASALASLASGQAIPPGDYDLQVSLNGEPLGTHRLALTLGPQQRWQVCLPWALLAAAGVNRAALQQPPEACVALEAAIPGSQVQLDVRRAVLNLSVPQAAMHRRLLGSTDPSSWDAGVNAGFINYQASTRQVRSAYSGSQQQADLYLDAGVNLGDWRLRSRQAYSSNSQPGGRWQRADTYAQRDITRWRSTLSLGERSTGGEVLRSVPIQGLHVASEQAMLPDVLQGYSPIVRGVANTRAKVEIRQNGYLLYTTFVSPGPFELDDLSVSGSGELEVSVLEEDGQVSRFTQPYSTLANLLREGVWRYSASVGRYNPAQPGAARPALAQGTLALGLPGNWTAYGGAMAASFYTAAQLGAARDLGQWGALSFDATTSASEAPLTGSQRGQSYAVRYGKAFATDTQLRFAGYRYSTEGYRDFDEAAYEHSRGALREGSRRSRLEVSLYQRLGSTLQAGLTGSQESYWGSGYQRRQLQANLSTRWNTVGVSLFASQTFDANDRQTRQVGVSVTLPLGQPRHTASFNVQRNGKQLNQRAALSGYHSGAGLGYNASLSRDHLGQNNGAFSTHWQGSQGSLSASVAQGNGYRSLGVNASGALVVHEGGLITAPQVGDTFAIVEVPGIQGVGLRTTTNLTNAGGYAVASGLQPYRHNTLDLDTSALGPEVLIDNGVQRVTPRRGAIVKAHFPARSVARLLITAHAADGERLPTGAELVAADGTTVTPLGQAGRALLESDGNAQRLLARWGSSPAERCWLDIDPALARTEGGYHVLAVTCTR